MDMDLMEFAVSAANEKESQTMLQLVRPKEGNLIQFGDGEPRYRYDGSLIAYISDIHLDNIIADSNCHTPEDVSAVVKHVVYQLRDSLDEYWSENGDRIVVLAGDITHSPELFSEFMNELYFWCRGPMIMVLGNHELWAYPGKSIDDIVKIYQSLTPKVSVVQNEIILFQDRLIDENYSLTFSSFLIQRISCDEILRLSVDELSERMKSARVVMLAGIGFSGCNIEFNAISGIYKNTLSRQEEILESNKFEQLYERFILASSAVEDRVRVVMTHMPIQDWHHNPIYKNGIIYISGHTHRNYFHDDGILRVYADNQNGYHGRHPVFKCVYLDDVYDPFISYVDGIYEVTKQDYRLFYQAKKLRMVMKRNYQTLYMLKKYGCYCFLARLASGKLGILNGGSCTAGPSKDVQYYFDRMDKIVDRVSNPLKQYTRVQTELSEAIKSFGGTGNIHGCIVDIDWFNHIYVNPVDLTMTPYFAMDMVHKWVYDSVPLMLENHSPDLYLNYQRLLESKSDNALIPISTNQIACMPDGTEYFETDIYKASRVISKMQKLKNDVLTFWNDGLLDAADRYVEPLKLTSKKDSVQKKLVEPKPKKVKVREEKPKVSKQEQMKKKYVGMTRMMNCGLLATVVEYGGYNDVTVQFEDGLIRTGIRSDHFMNGRVSHSQ